MQRPPNTVTGQARSTPAHAARPTTVGAGGLAVLGVAVLVAIGLAITAAQNSGGGRTHSTPSSAQHLTDLTTASPPMHR